MTTRKTSGMFLAPSGRGPHEPMPLRYSQRLCPRRFSAEELSKRRLLKRPSVNFRSDYRLLFLHGPRHRTWHRDRAVSFDSTGFQASRVAGMVNLGSKNRDFFGSLDTDLNGVAVDPRDFDMDQITDDDSLVHFPR